MKKLPLFFIFIFGMPFAFSQVPVGMPRGGVPDASTHVVEKPTAESVHGKAASNLPRSKHIPHGHTETPLTIKPLGGAILTKECGVVTELTVLHRSHEPAMVTHILSASKEGKQLLLADAKCLGGGKAVASSVSFAPAPQTELPLSERCKLPHAAGQMKGC